MHDFAARAIFFWTLAILTGFWVLGALTSWLTGMLTPRQMKAWHLEQGIPYLSHFGMLHDLVIHPVLALNAGMFLPVWLAMSGYSRFGVTFVAILAALGLNLYWGGLTATSGVVEAQARDGRLTIVGKIHVLHTAAILWLLGMMAVMLYDGVMHPILGVANIAIFAAHLLLGSHWPLKLLNPWWNPLGEATDRDRGTGIAYVVLLVVGLSSLCYWAIP